MSGDLARIDNTYSELMTQYKLLHKDIVSQVGLVDVMEGKKRYSSFADNGLIWKPEDYSHEGFRANYCDKLFVPRSLLICDILKYCESTNSLPDLLLDHLGAPRSLTVASFGCGPGSDLAGFHAYYDNMKTRRIQQTQSQLNFTEQQHQPTNDVLETLGNLQEAKVGSHVGYDCEGGWKPYVEMLGHSFQEHFIDDGFLQEMPCVDVAILCYFAHSAFFSYPIEPKEYIELRTQRWGKYEVKRNWDILMEKCNIILVVDTIRDVKLRNNLLAMRGFVPIHNVQDCNGRRVAVNVWCRDWQ